MYIAKPTRVQCQVVSENKKIGHDHPFGSRHIATTQHIKQSKHTVHSLDIIQLFVFSKYIVCHFHDETQIKLFFGRRNLCSLYPPGITITFKVAMNEFGETI